MPISLPSDGDHQEMARRRVGRVHAADERPRRAARQRHRHDLEVGRTLTHVAQPEQDAGRAGQDVHPLGRDLLGLRLDLVDRLDLPAGGPHPGHARVHLEVHVAVVAPVAGAAVGLVGQGDRWARRRATRSAPRLPFLMNPTRLPSGEKNGFEAPSVPAIGVASSWSMPPEPEARAALSGPDVRQRAAVARERDARSAARCSAAAAPGWLEREAELAQERRGRRAEPAPERGGDRRGQRHAEHRHEHARPAARGRRPAAPARRPPSAAGIDAVECVATCRAAPPRTPRRWRTGRRGASRAP